MCKDGDLCFEMEGPLIFGKIRKFDHHTDSHLKIAPAIRLMDMLFGMAREDLRSSHKGLFRIDVTERNFYIKEMQELSVQGGFRQTPLCCNDFSYRILILSFKLPKGSMRQRYCVN